MKLFVLRDEDAPPYDGESPISEVGAVAESPIQQRGYFRLHREVIDKCGISGAAVYGYLENMAQIGDQTGRGCVPSHKAIADGLGMSVRSVQRALIALRDAGLIAWEETTGKVGAPNRYFLPIYRGSAKLAEGVGQFGRPGQTDWPTGSVKLADKLERVTNQKSKNVESFVRSAPDPRSARLFDAWYGRYPPRRKNRKMCIEEWGKLKPEEWEAAGNGLQKWIESEDWREERYIVHAHRWLKNKRWTEDPEPRRQGHRSGPVPKEERVGTPEWAARTGKAVM